MAKRTNLKERIERQEMRKQLWDLTMQNIQRIGGKQYVFVPKELWFVDERFQRVDENSKGKINQLVKNWDINKMDALKGSLHPEELRISVIDGYHRVMAAQILDLPGLEFEVLNDMPLNPTERLIREATYFATQGDEVSRLTPVQKHKANVLRGINENVIVEELIQHYHIPLKANPSHGRVASGELAGFTVALNIAKGTGGKNMLNTVMEILCESRWNLSKNGLSSNALAMVYNILRLHPENEREICDVLVKTFTETEPNQIFARAYSKYDTRGEKERNLMYIEDLVCEELGITRVYHGGSIVTALNKIA